MRTIMRAALAALLVLSIGACATTAEKDAAVKDAQAQTVMKADLLDTAKTAAAAPLFKLTCPPTGCILASLEVGNPAAAAQMAEVVKVAFTPQPSVGAAIAHEFFDTVRTLGPIGLVSHGISTIMHDVTSAQTATASAGFSANSAIASHIPQPGAVTTTTNNTMVTASGPGAAAASGGTATGSAPTTTTSTTTTNSNNTNPAPAVVTCTGDPVVCTRG